MASRRKTASSRTSAGVPPAPSLKRVTVVLSYRHVSFLDRLSTNIREKTGAPIGRAELIRSVLDAVSEADLDLTASTSPAELRATLLVRLGRYRLDT